MSNDPKFKKNFKEFSFDVVLPSHLILNENVSTGAKLFYGLIRNLTRVEGYCYATNSYLSELMGMSERTIKDWLQELETEGYIEREFEQQEFRATRKIFISHNFQKSLTAGRISPPPRQNLAYPIKKIILKKTILKKNVLCPSLRPDLKALSRALFLRKKRSEK